MSFEKRLERLEQILDALEGDEIELGAALELFQEGVETLRAASSELVQVEAQVRRLVERSDGTFELVDPD
ncbi:MAG: exodeoxyribonuclease VII small subunit [Gemmatimonadaceae bacterium]|nr:exodeoxyribonuclease VII small subunit [Gemmatimonadaceae bacterium]